MSNEPRPSLLDQSPPLPGLALADLSEDERAQGEGRAEHHPCGEFSAARFHALYPERYTMIARALAEGFSLEAAARVFRIHERTAAAIREREARSLDAEAYRGIQARHARGVVLAATDELARRLREAPDKIGVRDLVAAVRELHNVERALEGAPSQVVGLIRADGASAALAELLKAAQDGFGRPETAAREAGRPVVEVQVVADAPADRPALTDSQSLPQNDIIRYQSKYNINMDTVQATTATAREPGDGASASAAAAPSAPPPSPSSPRPAPGGGGGARETGGSI